MCKQLPSGSQVEADKILLNIYNFHRFNVYPNLNLCDNDLKKIIDIFLSSMYENLFSLYISFSLYITHPKMLYKKYPMTRIKEYLDIFEALLTLLESYPEFQGSYATILEQCCLVKQKLKGNLKMMSMAAAYNSIQFNKWNSLVS